MKFNNRIDRFFYKKFNDYNLIFKTSKKDYEIRAVLPLKDNVPYDLSIKIGKKIIAIIEFKSTQFLDVLDYSRIENFASENNIRLFILSDGIKFFVIDRGIPNKTGTLNFEELIQVLTQREEINVEECKIQIAKLINQIFIDSGFLFLKEIGDAVFDQLLNALYYDELDQVFSFKNHSDINNMENRLFRFLLNDAEPLKKIFRYTTFNTLFEMLTRNSFRMNCLIGMNDPTEVNYVENYITGINHDYTQAHWQSVDAHNRRFISSCSLLEDNLTHWRLYGEDSKGICLVLRIHEENLESKFILKKINYGRQGNVHPELDLIKRIISELKDKLNIDFEFRTLSIWKHFFKPYDYAVEKEVRLLYILNDNSVQKGWLMTKNHGILNPYLDFKLNDDALPIELAEIVLGPKSPEKELNRKQLEQYIRELRSKKKKVVVNGKEIEVCEYNLSKIKVSVSSIKNYR